MLWWKCGLGLVRGLVRGLPASHALWEPRRGREGYRAVAEVPPEKFPEMRVLLGHCHT